MRTIEIPEYTFVDILSLREDRILAGHSLSGMLSIYHAKRGFEKNINLSSRGAIKDAAWLSDDEIMVSYGDKVCIISSENGAVVRPLKVTCSERFSSLVSGSTCLADKEDGVYKLKCNCSDFKFVFRTRHGGIGLIEFDLLYKQYNTQNMHVSQIEAISSIRICKTKCP